MEKDNFNLFDNISLNEYDNYQFYINKQISNIIVKIIEKRLFLKMSQRELAKKTCIKQPMIARIEKLESIPRLDTLIKILDALDLNICLKDDF